jgi:16S rRNA (cytosine1402-N4)-methyltransferase
MRYGSVTHLPPAQLESLNRLERALGGLPDVADILRHTSEDELAEIIFHYGEERFRGRIARALHRPPYPETSEELAERVAKAVPPHYRVGRLHPATRTFQALRLAVNRELEALEAALPQAYTLLRSGGILAIISFHSLEDRIVKTTFRNFGQQGATIRTKKPIKASKEELARNPRARSAKLRVLEKGGG